LTELFSISGFGTLLVQSLNSYILADSLFTGLNLIFTSLVVFLKKSVVV